MNLSPETIYNRALRGAERFTRTDMRYLVKGGFWLGINQLALGLIALLLSVAFAHYLTKDAYGTYRFVLSLFWTFTAFSLSGIPAALIRAVAKGETGAYRQGFRLSLYGGIPVAIVALLTSGYYFLNGNMLLSAGCLIIAAIGPFMQSAYLYGAFFEGVRDFRKNALFGIALNLVPALAMLALMQYTGDPLVFLAANLGLSVAVGLTISYLFIPRDARKSEKKSEGFLSLSGHFSAMNVLFTISQQADKIIVFHFLGAAPLAIYALAVSLPEQLRGLFGNIESLAFPKFATRSLDEIRRALPWRLLGLTGLIALAALMYMFAAPYIFSILFPKYPEAVFYSQLFALALIPIGNVIPISALQAHAKKRELYIFNIVSPLFQISVLTVGVMLFGLLGAVVARIIGRSFSFALSLILFYTARSSPTDH